MRFMVILNLIVLRMLNIKLSVSSDIARLPLFLGDITRYYYRLISSTDVLQFLCIKMMF